MNGPELSPSMDSLLVHADFVRGLAKSILFDDTRVDDVVQQTWLAALRSRPPKLRSEKAWLAAVTRNTAIKEIQRKTRTETREAAAAQEERLPSTAEIVEKEAARKELVDAVLALEEPYRSAILLRYYENLPPRQIAKRLGIPIDTVYTHGKRGLEKLREILDAKHRGNRQSWCLAIVPLALPAKSSSLLALAGLAGAAALLLGVGIKLYGDLSESSDTASSSKAALAAPLVETERRDAHETYKLAATLESTDPTPGPQGLNPGTEATPRTDLPTAQAPVAVVAAKISPPFSGVTLSEDGSPIANAEIFAFDRGESFVEGMTAFQFDAFAETSGWLRVSLRTNSDDLGNFAFLDFSVLPRSPRIKGGEEIVMFSKAKGYLPSRHGPYRLDSLPEERAVFRMRKAVAIEGRVACAETGLPLAGARIGCFGKAPNESGDQNEIFAQVESDGEGRFRMETIPLQAVRVYASAHGYQDDGKELDVSEESSRSPLDLKLHKEPWEILGRILTPDGKPVPDQLRLGERGPSYSYFSILGFPEDPQKILDTQTFDSRSIRKLWSKSLMLQSKYRPSDGGFGLYPHEAWPWELDTVWVVLQVDGLRPQIRAVRPGDPPVEFIVGLKEIEKNLCHFFVSFAESETKSAIVIRDVEILAYLQGESAPIGMLVGSSDEESFYRVPKAGVYDLLVRAKGRGPALLRKIAIKQGERLPVGPVAFSEEARVEGRILGTDPNAGMPGIVTCFDSEGRNIGDVDVDKEGRFTVEGLGSDRIRLEALVWQNGEKGPAKRLFWAETVTQSGQTTEVVLKLGNP